MSITNYWIRAEHQTPGGQSYYEDFQVMAEDRINAQIKAEHRIRSTKSLLDAYNFRWCGMVVFVNLKDGSKQDVIYDAYTPHMVNL